MRLEKIKLSGFKSFVDATTIPFNSDLVGVVGPNGCGKSNVIDAVRWVLGESSAKHLRGGQMTDVVFNGSTTRKPVGQAFVELTFDNSDATISGEFAGYREILLKRQINREGQSVYFLNGTRCRRKDITGLFLGTGLGPRSYAIIEQGTISRLVEAKPDELRVFLEEAAGISKYKERRRDAENRMRRTRENLNRIADLCDEIDKQCQHLKRQASTAARYKVLKAEERHLKARLLALRWQTLDKQEAGNAEELGLIQLSVDKGLAEQRGLERNIEQQRETLNAQRETLSEIQAMFYSIGSDIAKAEQTLKHQKTLKHQQLLDLEGFNKTLRTAKQTMLDGRKQILESNELIAASEKALFEAMQQEGVASNLLTDAEQVMNVGQKTWEDFAGQLAEPKRKRDIEKTNIEQLERHLVQLQQRLSTAKNEQLSLQQGLGDVDLSSLQEEHAALESHQQNIQEQLQANLQRASIVQKRLHADGEALSVLRSEHARLAGRLESILVLQRSGAVDSADEINEWLLAVGLADAAKLIEKIDVVAGWEKAVEIVLGKRLHAICVGDETSVLNAEPPVGELMLFGEFLPAQPVAYRKTSLANLVSSNLPTLGLLKHVHVADDLKAATVLMASLSEHESVITKAGVWLHADMVSFQGNSSISNALLLEKEKKELLPRLAVLVAEVGDKEERVMHALADIVTLDELVRDLRSQESEALKNVSCSAMQLSEKTSRAEHATQRLLQIAEDIHQVDDDKRADEASLNACKKAFDIAVSQSAALDAQCCVLQAQRDTEKAALDAARIEVHRSREQTHDLRLTLESQRSSQALTEQHASVAQERLATAADKAAEIQGRLELAVAPSGIQQDGLNHLLLQRVEIEKQLTGVRAEAELIEQGIREDEMKRQHAEQHVGSVKDALSAAKMEHQEVLVRKQTLVEQLQESGVELESMLMHMPADVSDAQWQMKEKGLANKINQLGLINLTAIEEYEAQSERKEYLDRQQLDLTESLKILDAAIEKIDKESRLLFKQTFDKVNEGFAKRFPKLFGGGNAYLQQTGDDMLDAGVTVMAQPPGKRNSSIQLLSGGEKALTAVALVFAIFDLNPSPFCMLDEVDAPLDEANVERFSALVKDMSQTVQMILITHNKVTMEKMNQLSGVTMKEPGVSRLVSVDLEEAATMAEN